MLSNMLLPAAVVSGGSPPEPTAVFTHLSNGSSSTSTSTVRSTTVATPDPSATRELIASILLTGGAGAVSLVSCTLGGVEADVSYAYLGVGIKGLIARATVPTGDTAQVRVEVSGGTISRLLCSMYSVHDRINFESGPTWGSVALGSSVDSPFVIANAEIVAGGFSLGVTCANASTLYTSITPYVVDRTTVDQGVRAFSLNRIDETDPLTTDVTIGWSSGTRTNFLHTIASFRG